MVGIGMAIEFDGGAAELRPGVDAGMRQFIGQDQVAGSRECRNNAGIGEITGAEHTSRVGRLQPRQPRFQFSMERVIAGHQSRCAGAGTVTFRRVDRRLDDRRVPAKIEIIVAGKGNQAAAGALDIDAVTRRDDRRAAQAHIVQCRKLAGRKVIERAHRAA